MNGLNQHRSAARLDIDIAKSPKRHSAAGVKRMQQSFGRPFSQLLLNHKKEVRFNRLELKMSAIANAATTLGTFGAASLQLFRQQTSTLGQRLMSTGGHLAKDNTASVPGDHVTTVGDVNLCMVITSFDSSALVERVEFGMERSTEDVKR
jgi:hypothetical protein